jgi:hypothetical protein
MRMNMICRTELLLLVLGVGLLTSATPVVGQDTQQLLQLAQLDATQQLDRMNAREELKKYLENTADSLRPALIQALITALPSYSPLAKMTICKSLESLSFFWTATNQEEAEKSLYQWYQKEPDPALKAALDRALMRAKGLYRDALDDFNNSRVGPAVEPKFRRVYENYPKSSLAAKAHFYLGVYPLRVYAILKKRNQQPKLEEYVKQSNEVLQDFLTKAASYGSSSQPNQVLDAHYFRALNFVLLNQIDEAINELKAIETDKSSAEKIYVYQFFYSNLLGEVTGSRLVVENDIVDKFFAGRTLAKYTREYLESNKGKNFKEQEELRKFTEKLKQFKDEKK